MHRLQTAAELVPKKLTKSSASKPAISPIQTQFKAYKVYFLANELEELEPASSVSPGDVVAYVARHRNASPQRLLNVDFAIPIPCGTTLWQGSVQPDHGALVDEIHQTFNTTAANTTVAKNQKRVAWRVDRLEPGQSIELKIRVSIDADPTLPAKAAPSPFRLNQPQLRN